MWPKQHIVHHQVACYGACHMHNPHTHMYTLSKICDSLSILLLSLDKFCKAIHSIPITTSSELYITATTIHKMHKLSMQAMCSHACAKKTP